MCADVVMLAARKQHCDLQFAPGMRFAALFAVARIHNTQHMQMFMRFNVFSKRGVLARGLALTRKIEK